METPEEFHKKVQELYKSKLLEKYSSKIEDVKKDIMSAIDKGQNSFTFFVDEDDQNVLDFLRAYFKGVGEISYHDCFNDTLVMTLNFEIPNLNDDWA
jgi:hypothetical protein